MAAASRKRTLLAAWLPAEFMQAINAVAEILGISKSDLVRGAVARALLSLAEEEVASSEPQAETCQNGHPRTEENTRHRPDGYRECRVCHREGVRRYRQAHKEEIRESERKASRNYYQVHREEILERRRKQREANPERQRERQREYMRQYRERKKLEKT